MWISVLGYPSNWYLPNPYLESCKLPGRQYTYILPLSPDVKGQCVINKPRRAEACVPLSAPCSASRISQNHRGLSWVCWFVSAFASEICRSHFRVPASLSITPLVVQAIHCLELRFTKSETMKYLGIASYQKLQFLLLPLVYIIACVT